MMGEEMETIGLIGEMRSLKGDEVDDERIM